MKIDEENKKEASKSGLGIAAFFRGRARLSGWRTACRVRFALRCFFRRLRHSGGRAQFRHFFLSARKFGRFLVIFFWGVVIIRILVLDLKISLNHLSIENFRFSSRSLLHILSELPASLDQPVLLCASTDLSNGVKFLPYNFRRIFNSL